MKLIYFRYQEAKHNWQQAWGSLRFRWLLGMTAICLVLLLSVLSFFFTYIETRNGQQLDDIILKELPSYNLSFYTFMVIYLAALLSIVNLSDRPAQFIQAVQAYFMLLLLRIITIYFWPLEAPVNIVPLQDPFVETFFYGHTRITKDLFFSGHVATVSLLYLVNPYKKLNWLYLSVVILVAAFILLQHAHYSVDVLTAPLFAWLCWWLAKHIS